VGSEVKNQTASWAALTKRFSKAASYAVVPVAKPIFDSQAHEKDDPDSD
jgi:hypothetical protein